MRNLVIIICAVVLAHSALAQNKTGPAPGSTVFKCEQNGTVIYSDAPCQSKEASAEAMRPVTGLDAKQHKTSANRSNLTTEAKRECVFLDHSVSAAELRERNAPAESRPALQQELFGLRKRLRELKC